MAGTPCSLFLTLTYQCSLVVGVPGCRAGDVKPSAMRMWSNAEGWVGPCWTDMRKHVCLCVCHPPFPLAPSPRTSPTTENSSSTNVPRVPFACVLTHLIMTLPFDACTVKATKVVGPSQRSRLPTKHGPGKTCLVGASGCGRGRRRLGGAGGLQGLRVDGSG